MANNFNISIDLLKMKAAVMGIKGKECVKKCVVIPIDDNDLCSKVSDDGKVSVYLNLTAWENRKDSPYGDTHMVKQSHSKEWNESHNKEDRKSEPILGNCKPVAERTVDSVNVPTAEVIADEDDVLPF